MPGVLPTYLQDSNGLVWMLTASPIGQLRAIHASPPLSAPSAVAINDTVLPGQTWALSILPNGQLDELAPTTLSTNLNQIPITSPAGALYYIQVRNKQLITIAGSFPCASVIGDLGVNVMNRLEEELPPSGPAFWDLTKEIYSGLVEAMNDLLLLVGRPTQAVTLPITLTPNSVWQTLPKGIFLIANLYGTQGEIRQTNLSAMDYVQASWGSDWENDVGPTVLRWGPLGFNRFFVHPAPLVATQLTLTGLQYPASDLWPYNGSEVVPFRHEFHVALELYAAHYARIKETGKEFEESLSLYGQYLSLAERMTQIEDIRDPVIFSRALGAPNPVSPITKR